MRSNKNPVNFVKKLSLQDIVLTSQKNVIRDIKELARNIYRSRSVYIEETIIIIVILLQ